MAITKVERVLLINQTSNVGDDRFQAALPWLQLHVSRDFAPKWGTDAVLLFAGRGQQLDMTATQRLFLRDTSDEAGDLGYHVDDNGFPQSFVFVGDDIRYGASITVTISHEIDEALGDPTTELLSPRMPDGYRYALESCDPTERDEDGLEIAPDITVTNAVTPAYYGYANADGSSALDLYGRIMKPVPFFTDGGYGIRIDDANNWSNTMQAQRTTWSRRALESTKPHHRHHHRMMRHAAALAA